MKMTWLPCSVCSVRSFLAKAILSLSRRSSFALVWRFTFFGYRFLTPFRLYIFARDHLAIEMPCSRRISSQRRSKDKKRIS